MNDRPSDATPDGVPEPTEGATPPVPADPRDLRCSDTDREKVAETLRAAMGDGRIDVDELQDRLDRAYAAKTYRELEPIIADLPGGAAVPLPVVRPDASAARPGPTGLDRVGGTATSTAAVAIMSGSRRTGAWVVPEDFTALAVMGGVELDLREARFASRAVTINAVAFWGGVEVVAGPDINVRVDGIGIMGGFDGPRDEVDDGRVSVRVTGLALMGGVEVKRKGKGKSKGSGKGPLSGPES